MRSLTGQFVRHILIHQLIDSVIDSIRTDFWRIEKKFTASFGGVGGRNLIAAIGDDIRVT